MTCFSPPLSQRPFPREERERVFRQTGQGACQSSDSFLDLYRAAKLLHPHGALVIS